MDNYTLEHDSRTVFIRPYLLPYDFPGDNNNRKDQCTTLLIGTIVWGIFAALGALASTYKS